MTILIAGACVLAAVWATILALASLTIIEERLLTRRPGPVVTTIALLYLSAYVVGVITLLIWLVRYA